MNFLLDTNVVSESRRRLRNPQVAGWLARVDRSTRFISVLTLGELGQGVARVTRRDPAAANALANWLREVREDHEGRTIPVDFEIAERWGSFGALRPLSVIDGLIAATALVRGMTLVTRNVRDVAGTGVQLLDPWAG